MYESYSWPGAYSLKTEFKMLVKFFKESLLHLAARIKKAEGKI